MASRRLRSKAPFLVFECVVEGCDAEFYLNDIPVVRRGTEIGAFFGAPSHQYIVDGENEIGILVHPGPTPDQALAGANGLREQRTVSGAKAMARLVRYPYGAVVGGPDGEMLMHCDWQAPADETTLVFPRAVSNTVDLGPQMGTWAWEDAERLDLGEDDLAELSAFLEDIRTALDAGNPDPLIDHSRARLADVTRAYGLPPAQKENQIRNVTEVDAQQPWWGMQPLDPAAFAWRLCANDRLVELIGVDWDPVLKEQPDDNDGIGQYAMFVGKRDGAWEILL